MTAVPPPLDDAFDAAAERCRRILATDFAALAGRLEGAPASPEAWFGLLERVPDDDGATRMLARLKQQADRTAHGLVAPVERLAVLNAVLAAAPRMRRAAADDTVKRLFCDLCADIAAPPPAWETQFDMDGAPFVEMAQLATLRRLPAGQLVFDYTDLPQSWLLKLHPLDLPATLREIGFGLGGFGPIVSPHLNHWRANPLLLLKSEYLRSLWRIARTLELRPDVRGLMADAWFYAAEVGELFPHLAWVRQFFIDQGAFFVEMEPASPDSGFLVGSARRRELYQQGRFRPRRTLVLWRRADLLAWAAANPGGELGAPAASPPNRMMARDAPAASPPNRMMARDAPAATPPNRMMARDAPPRPARAHRQRVRPLRPRNRPPVIDGTPLLNRSPKVYAAAALLAPALAVALAAAAVSPWAAVPAFLAALPLLWMLQYFYFQ